MPPKDVDVQIRYVNCSTLSHQPHHPVQDVPDGRCRVPRGGDNENLSILQVGVVHFVDRDGEPGGDAGLEALHRLTAILERARAGYEQDRSHHANEDAIAHHVGRKCAIKRRPAPERRTRLRLPTRPHQTHPS